jgi:hypothetical protein
VVTFNKEVFERWWNTSIRSSDSDEFVHGPFRGTEEGAFFCCAYDILRATGEEPLRDLVVQAYIISQGMDPSAAKMATTRLAAQGMFEEDSVQFLLDKVEYRKRAEAEERIHSIVVAKIDELEKRTKQSDNFETEQNQLTAEKLLIDAGLRYMADRTKQKAIDMKRREHRALRESMVKGKEQLKNVTQVPSKEEIRQFFVMAREMLTDKEFAELSGSKALNSGD